MSVGPDFSAGDVAIIVSVLNFAGVILASILGRLNNKAIQRLEINMDGKMEALIAAEKGKSLAEGIAQGTAIERKNPQVDSTNAKL